VEAEPSGPARPADDDPATPLWRGTVVLRIVTFLFALGVFALHANDYARPWLGWPVIGTMGAWTAFTAYAYRRQWGRRAWVVVADLVLTCGLMTTSLLVLTDEQMIRPVPLITTVWGCGPVVSVAVYGGRTWGMLAGVVVAAVNWSVRGYFNTDMARDTVLLVGVGVVIGMASQTARRSAEQLSQALRTEAATAERERLARSIHDGVLQVLARVRRRGAELGGEAADLANLAGGQEIALRALVSAAPESTVDGEVDVRGQLQLLATPRVQVSVPATQVMLPAAAVAEATAVVAEALSNVDKHAGDAARAWVLLEDLGDEVVVSVRDDGPGIPAGRLAAAEAEGRLGIAKSMRGRVATLGGTLVLQTGPGEGTEWEVRLPRQRSPRRGRRESP
jgi:signal transduction histidine kinase